MLKYQQIIQMNHDDFRKNTNKEINTKVKFENFCLSNTKIFQTLIKNSLNQKKMNYSFKKCDSTDPK